MRNKYVLHHQHIAIIIILTTVIYFSTVITRCSAIAETALQGEQFAFLSPPPFGGFGATYDDHLRLTMESA